MKLRVEFHQGTSRVAMLHHLALRGSNPTAKAAIQQERCISISKKTRLS